MGKMAGAPLCVRCGETAAELFSRKAAERAAEIATGLPRTPTTVCCARCRPSWIAEKELEQRRLADEVVVRCCECRAIMEAGQLSRSQRRKPASDRRCARCAQKRDAERKLLRQGLRTESSQRLCNQQKKGDPGREGADGETGGGGEAYHEEEEGTWHMIGGCSRYPLCGEECMADHAEEEMCRHDAWTQAEAHEWHKQISWRMSRSDSREGSVGRANHERDPADGDYNCPRHYRAGQEAGPHWTGL